MAVVFMAGFDYQSAVQIIGTRWSGAANTVIAGRLAGQAVTVVNSATLTAILPSSYSTIHVGYAASFTVASTDVYCNLVGAAANRVRLELITSGATKVFNLKNNAGTTLATGTTPIVANTWYYLELKVVISATVGTVELRLNGSTTAECSGTGLNTGSTNIDSINFITSASQQQWVDDLYVIDTTGSAPTNTWLGDVRIETLKPSGNSATNTAWAGVYTDYDDATSHDGESTTITSSTPGDRETATLTDLSVGTGTVFAVQTHIVARKDDAGTRTVAPVLRFGGNNYDGTTSAALSTTYQDLAQIYDRQDPSPADWSISTVNAMEAGVKEVA